MDYSIGGFAMFKENPLLVTKVMELSNPWKGHNTQYIRSLIELYFRVINMCRTGLILEQHQGKARVRYGTQSGSNEFKFRDKKLNPTTYLFFRSPLSFLYCASISFQSKDKRFEG